MPPLNEGNSLTVEYTIKEVLDRIDRKLDTMSTLISLKADRADLESLKERHGETSRRLLLLEQDTTTKAAILSNTKKSNLAIAGLIIQAVGGLLGLGALWSHIH